MTKTLTKKEQTHQRMLDAASRCFKSNGFAGIGVDGIAKEAGATSGAFYAHMGSKDAAFQAVLGCGLENVIEGKMPALQRDHGPDWVKAFVDYYIGQPHRADLECGCAMASLTPEVARSGGELKEVYESKMSKIVDIAANGLAGDNLQDRRARAWAMLSTLIGGLNVLRAMGDADSTEFVAQSIKTAAINIAGQTQ